MGIRIQWQGTVPAGSDGEKNFVLGAVPEGKKLLVSALSYYGGDAGERYGINLIPASQSVENATVDGLTGGINWLYPMGGGTQTVGTPLTIPQNNSWNNNPIPGPCTIAVSTVTATAAALVVNLLGILEDL
mgnify:CR=1 FL=1|jgi:hypothetical protein|tara:strand:+ start:202 stop:594 length:393 start_codon:yes stop_codon:yes gene_type:complete